MKILFMGTPTFAVPSLQILTESRHQLVGVVTAQDKPKGRGLKISCSPVKEAALRYDAPILQPSDLHNPSFIGEIKKLDADLFVVVAFRILPEQLFELPSKGTINLHASLLPKYRGAAPINWAIINGEKSTGVTTIFIEKTVDTGDIILQQKTDIGEEETAGELHDKLARLGAQVLLKTVDLIEKGDVPRKPQFGDATKAPKITKETGNINWHKTNIAVHNLVRGLSPAPGAYTCLSNRLLKIYQTKPLHNSETHVPGEILEADVKNNRLVVACGIGKLQLMELQPEGKRKMSTHDFLLGNPIKAGDQFRMSPQRDSS